MLLTMVIGILVLQCITISMDYGDTELHPTVLDWKDDASYHISLENHGKFKNARQEI